jgi:hypothetical protein
MILKLFGGMQHMRYYIILAVLFAMLFGTCIAENAKTGDVNAFKQALEKDGFTVQQGSLGYLDLIKLYDQGTLPSAYGNNPTTKYLTYFIPPAPGYKVPDLFAKIAMALGMGTKVSAFWSLRPDEAIVFVGRTPPECRYFSYDYYLLSRTYGNETRWLFVPLADTVNNFDINTEGTPNGLPGNPFNQTTIVVAAADRGIDQRIRDAALSAGYSGDIFNTQVLPSMMLNMGLENSSDNFLMLIRPALYKNKQAGDNYRNNVPAAVFRVTPNESTKLDPYNYPALAVRGTGKTEFDLMDDLGQLRNAILDKYGNLNATELPTSIATPSGSDAIQKGTDALGPANDACYLWTSSRTPDSPTPPFPNISQYQDFVPQPAITLGNNPNEFIIVYGVNHVATGKSTYENIVPYGEEFNGIGEINDTALNGTAEAYLPNNPDAKYLYVYKIARNRNGDPNCFVVPTGPGAYGVGLDQTLFIAWRLYLEKATKTGPSYSEIVYDRAIKFSPKK